MNRDKIIKQLDKMDNFTAKLDYLNKLFLKAKTFKDETLILEIIQRLKRGY